MKTIAKILTDRNTFTTTLLAILFDKYDASFMEWDPDIAVMQIQEDFKIQLPSIISDRIQAGCTLFTSNLFHVSFETFSTLCNVMAFVPITPNTLLLPSLDECLWGCTEARLLEGPTFLNEGFGHDTSRYVGELLNVEGIYKPPSVLSFAEYPEDVEQRNQTAFDDPISFKAFWDDQHAVQEQLEDISSRKLTELFKQLQELPMDSVDQSFIKGILETISGQE